MNWKKYIPKFIINSYHLSLSFISALIYGFPSKKIKVIGVTGTGGKSTVISIASSILTEAGHKVATSSSISFIFGGKEVENKLKMTMPGRFILQKFLKDAVKEGCDYAIIEVTSEGVKQHRHRFIDFQVAAITNLNPEHIEAHGGFENYKKAKGEFFNSVKGAHIINLDDKHAEYFLGFKANEIFGYGIDNLDARIRGSNVSVGSDGSKFKVNGIDFETKLLCEFNVYNVLAGISIGVSQGVDLETCRRAVLKVDQIAGRMEQIIFEPFRVFVDYAFTPVALEKVYKFLKPTQGKLICVLGSCGGGRDKWKRPVLGEIADKYGDIIIITNEDPYDEDPMGIINDVAKGSPKAQKIFDRREAINAALKLASPNDVVVITGKGCEPWICVAEGKKIAWDDRKIVKEELDKLNKS
ncbi:MAG: UDP-N-acetylmuramoyl-L-alanyl-D-glutamate--2,6-diaminopimelate ligase [Candidatus Pacebacteria bacterium]|nr:UDP-N-acetylmuramoyl-L-alanyl-D-glutamate--2,6-diaminopimelate ligase [Candidatus Paceibacterota bacterium]